MEEISADKAYLSQDNFNLTNEHKATLYVPFKSNSQPFDNGMVWKKMYHYFMMNNEKFLQHYHKRSNVESNKIMIIIKIHFLPRSIITT